jgi:hypothetical protein
MTAQYLSATGPAPASQPCGCAQHTTGGRHDCDCDCDAGCLTRPHFYCGMVLTDEQLNDLATWVSRRAALHRYVEGWGVVRGLAVHCDPRDPGGVLIGPGYARSCCGDDIVTCASISVTACGCEPKGACCHGAPAGHAAEGPRAVDLYLRYARTWEDPAQLRAECGCGAHDSVQYARIAEGGTVACVPVADPSTDPAALAAREWERGYRARATVVTDYLREVSDKASREDRLKWLLSWIDRADDADSAALCCLRRRLCGHGLGEEESAASAALIEIVSALRARYLEATFGQCHRPQGVLLARVWLGADDKGRCVVDCVDANPPFRRVLAAPGWPPLPGHVNVASLFWQRRAVAGDRARELGLRVAGWYDYRAPAEVSELARFLEEDSGYVRADAECEAQLYRDRCGHWGDDENDGRVLRLRQAAS